MDSKSSTGKLRSLLEPLAVAVVGASSTKGKIGHEILRNIVEGKFAGAIYPVNPHERVILDLKVYQSISDIPSRVDTCIITAPPESVPRIMVECGRKRVKGAVIVTAGFSEIGNVALEKEVLRTAAEGGVRVIGPNCAGIINTERSLYATIESRVAPGPIALITQSGAFGGAMLAAAKQQQLGFSKFVSYGNRCDIDEADLLEYLLEDPQTKVIAAYIEGLRDGRRFIQVARRVNAAKPIVAIKAGCSEEGSRATLSHTGSLAGSDHIYDGAFRQAGIIRAEDVDDLLDMAKALSTQPPSQGDRVGVVTNSGGPGVMLVDALARLGLKPHPPSTDTRNRLGFLPVVCSRNNPVDLTAAATPEDFGRTLDVLAASDDFDALVAMWIPPAYQRAEPVSEVLLSTSRRISKTLLACLMAGDLVREAARILEMGGLPTFPTPRRVAKATWALVQRHRYLASTSPSFLNPGNANLNDP